MTPSQVLHASLPPRARLWGALALGILANVSAVALLATSMWLITRAAERPPILFLSFAVVGVRAFALGRAFFRYLERISGHDAVFRQLPSLRVRLFGRLAELAPWGISRAGRGDTLSRFVRDIDELQFHPLRVVLPSVAAVAVTVLAALGVGLLNTAAALAIVLVLAVGTGLAALVTTQSSHRQAEFIAPARGEFADRVLDAVSNWDVLVAFGADRHVIAGVNEAGNALSARERSVSGRGGLANSILIISGGVAIALVALFVAPEVSRNAISVPGAAVLILIPIALADLLAAIPLALHARGASRGAAVRISELLPEITPTGIPDEQVELAFPVRTIAALPRLEFTGASASYPDSSALAVHNLTFAIEPGELILLTGPSGAGKSTVAQVAVRLLDYRGSVTLDGVELRALGADQVRQHLVLCEQSPWLFRTTIRGNLQFAHPGVTDDELTTVIDRVGLTEWMRERGGLDAEVGEHGELVSGGQAQRLALARALLSKAPIVVCDEPTANVDPVLAERLLRDIASLTPERSVLVISHQPLPVDISARTLQMREGRLR